jgi:hypothetical protein
MPAPRAHPSGGSKPRFAPKKGVGRNSIGVRYGADHLFPEMTPSIPPQTLVTSTEVRNQVLMSQTSGVRTPAPEPTAAVKP